MNTKLIIVVLAVIVIGGAFYFWSNNGMPSMNVMNDENGQMENDAPLAPDALAGEWRSTDDSNFTRTFYENGGYVDAYVGEDVSTNGPWVAFTADTAPIGFQYPTEEGVVYLELIGEAGPMYFSIAELDEDSLVLIYLDRGGVLEFERVVPEAMIEGEVNVEAAL